MGNSIWTALAITGAAIFTQPAFADSARCFTSDDGEYDCELTMTDNAGSFEISAEGKPTYSLIVEEPLVANVFGDFGTGSTPLPGPFIQDDLDPACWVNGQTDTRICAW